FLQEFMGEPREQTQGGARGPGTEADAPHTQALKLRNRRRGRTGQHVRRAVNGLHQPPDSLRVVDAGYEQAIRAGLAVGARATDGALEPGGGLAYLGQIDIRAGVDDHVYPERRSRFPDASDFVDL